MRRRFAEKEPEDRAQTPAPTAVPGVPLEQERRNRQVAHEHTWDPNRGATFPTLSKILGRSKGRIRKAVVEFGTRKLAARAGPSFESREKPQKNHSSTCRDLD